MTRFMTFGFATLIGILSTLFMTAVSTADDGFAVMTYNIRYQNERDGDDRWVHRRDTVIKAIAEADIVGLQEVVLSQLDAIKAVTSGWTWVGVGRDDGASAGEFSPIGFRDSDFRMIDQDTRWLSESPEVAGSKGWDAALPRVFTWAILESKSTQTQIMIINTHFDHVGKVARLNSAKAIARWIDENATMPVLCMGDFNAQSESDVLSAAKSGKLIVLRDARSKSASSPEGPTGTWNGFKAMEPNSRIDHILVDDRVSVETYRTLDPRTPSGRFASDHHPVVVRIGF
ncbi:endonuclease/exonuclease/phosphatase family protein [Rubripirellula tenax]|uniref:endonuclease/exonuclease/phosphatase family protein n=1 Tax=Rubripirellula tenax TaxID=2528015 RepID=UPI001FE69916|nr:endonuclease/exonuclease/phosphatase family protein [Rubripirellula tenax]